MAGPPRRRIGAWLHGLVGTFGRDQEREYGLQLDRALATMLPALGTAFGIGVVLFGAWDYWIQPERGATTTLIRLSLVLVGALGYGRWPGLPVAWRCVLIYGTHVGAMIFSSALLPDGLVLAMPAITGAMFPLALVEPRLHRLFLVVLIPSLLFVPLGATVMPGWIFASSMAIYLISLGLMAAVAIFTGRLRRAAWLAERELAYSARHDSLSGVYARGYLLELASHDVALAQRHGRPLAAGMLDIDHFKRVNDTFGHPAGDALIRELGRVCPAELRASDYFGRVGGEEFVFVMPETRADDALACAERMRRAVAAIRLPTPAGTLQCTVSIGVAMLDRSHADVDALLADADAALYYAKAHGRDRVVPASALRA